MIAGRFRVESVAGKGGMGTVFRAKDEQTGDVVALKIVEGEFANARFEREAMLLSRLDDAGIVRYVAHGGAGPGKMYLAMEWLEGTPLDAALAGGALAVSDAVALARRIARALAAAHAAGIVHRDVKPSNVILRGGAPDDAVLVDFGIARASMSSFVMTATGAVIGTPAYMAPEQARGQTDVGAPADVFSLGCVLFECLAGRAPFTGEHIIAVLAKILLEPAPRVRSLRADVPSDLDALVAAMLEKDPAARPADATAVGARLAALHEIGAGSSAAPRPLPAIGQAERRFATVLLARTPARDGETLAFASTEEALAGLTEEGVIADVGALASMTVAPLADGMFVGALVAEDAAVRVARCALALSARLPRARIALATGRAIVSAEIPVGDAIDRAARLLAEQRTPGHVAIDEATAALVEGRFGVARDGARWTLGPEEASSEAPRTVLGRVVPFVGREREIGLLEATFRECVDEPVARATIVLAPPGTGKTRLAHELILRLPDPSVWRGISDPGSAGVPFALAHDVLRRILGLGGETPDGRRAKIRARLGREGCFLGEITAAPFADDEDPGLRAARRSPELLAARVEDAFAKLAEDDLARGPLLVVLEDLQCADRASVRLFGGLLARLKDRPLMLLALARPSLDETHPHLWDEVRCQRISLEPLLRKAAERIARAVLGDCPDIEAIVRRAEGNALFVEELARARAEGRAPGDLPPTIAAAAESRLAALAPRARQVLRAAAIFGEGFWSGGVAHLLGGEPVDDVLVDLERRELVTRARSSRFAGEQAYAFRHALMRDAAYAMLTEADLGVGHALAGEWLAARIDDAALLASFFERGDRPAEAARWFARAAEQALAANDFAAVPRNAARAAALGAAGADLGHARLAEAEAALWIGDNLAARTASVAALAALEPGAERWFLATGIAIAATGKIGESAALHALVGDLERTPAKDERAGRARAIARARGAIQLAFSFDIARADALLEGCEREPGAAGDPGVLAWLCEAMCERGQAAGEPEHPSVARRGRALCLEVGDRRASFGHWANEVQALTGVGAFAEAVAVGDALLAAAGEGFVSVYVVAANALDAATRGDFSRMRAFIDMLARMTNPRGQGNFLALTAQLLASAGRFDEARAAAEESFLVAREPVAFAARARVALAAGDVPTALAASAQAMEIGEKGIVVVGVAAVHLARADALLAGGRTAEAKDVLAAGVARVMRATTRLAEYTETFLAAWENPRLLARARELGVGVASPAAS